MCLDPEQRGLVGNPPTVMVDLAMSQSSSLLSSILVRHAVFSLT